MICDLLIIIGIAIGLTGAICATLCGLCHLIVLLTHICYYNAPEGKVYRAIRELIRNTPIPNLSESRRGSFSSMGFQEPNNGYWYNINYVTDSAFPNYCGILVDIRVCKESEESKGLNPTIYDIKLPMPLRGSLYAKAQTRFDKIRRAAERQRRAELKREYKKDLNSAIDNLTTRKRGK